MGMRFYRLQGRAEQGQLKIYWAPGDINLTNYFSKRHPASHHKTVIPIYLYIEGKKLI